MADGGVEVKSPFEKHDYGPEDIAGHVYFAYQQTDEGRPQLVWDIQMEGVHPTIRLEMAEHFEALSNSIKNSYWSYVHDEAGDDAPLTPTEDRTYE